MQKSKGIYKETKNSWQVKKLHNAYIILGQDSKVIISISQLTNSTNLPNFTRKKLFARWLKDSLIW